MTTTQTLQSAKVQTQRRYDYIYDPLFTMSSNRDHARERYRTYIAPDRVKKVPHYGPMFSGLNHFPKHQMQIDSCDPVPSFMSRKWQGYQKQPVQQQHDNAHLTVSGSDRYKFSRRPIIPFLQQVPPDVLLQTTRVDPTLPPAEQQQSRPPTPLTWTVGVQTVFRESEAQTDPYTPEYVTEKGTVPELLTLASLSYHRGLPAGLAEVEMIERAREKRAWEQTLPPVDDVSQLSKRRAMMEELERKEWVIREKEIEKLQHVRLQVLKQILEKREEDNTNTNTERLNNIWSKKQAAKEAKFKKMRTENIKVLRKLTSEREKVEGKLSRRNIVSDYSSFASQVYAPQTRVGVFLDRGSELYNVKNRYLNTYEGLLELESSLPDYVTQPRIKIPNLITGKGGAKKRFEKRLKELDDTAELIKQEKDKEFEVQAPPRFLQKVVRPPPRPPTPSVETPSEEEEKRELAVIFLQQLLRGRAIQNMMQEGREKRMELIDELRSTVSLKPEEEKIIRENKKEARGVQRKQRMMQHKESLANEVLEGMEGRNVGSMADFLSKELVRLQEEQRIHAFALLAERKRRMREAEESGKRQVEERRRLEEDEIWRHLCNCHQGTMESYLEDIIARSVDRTADEQARSEIQTKAEKINEIAFEMESKRDRLQSENMVAELVYSFLLPETEKETLRQNLRREQRKHILAAHSVIYGQTADIEKDLGSDKSSK